jgi:uncharacterized protein (TIGR00369 family)
MVWQEEPRGGFPDLARFRGLSGIEQMRAFIRGQAPPPPLAYLTGMRPTDASVGSSAFTMPASGWLLSPQGLISGGVLAVLADGPLAGAVQTALPPATAYVTYELSLAMLRPVPADGGTLVGRGQLVHGGRSLALSEVFILDPRGRLVAHGSSRCFVFPPLKPGEPPDPALAQPSEPTFATPHPFERPPEGEVVAGEVWASLDGLTMLKAHIAGDLPAPPIAGLTGLHPVEVAAGEAVFALPATGWLCTPHGNVEGGAIALLADSAMAAAVQTTVPAGAGYATIDLKVNFLRPVPPDGAELTASARVVHRGATMAAATAEVRNAAGKKVALASGSAMVVAHPVTAAHPVTPVEDPPGQQRQDRERS